MRERGSHTFTEETASARRNAERNETNIHQKPTDVNLHAVNRRSPCVRRSEAFVDYPRLRRRRTTVVVGVRTRWRSNNNNALQTLAVCACKHHRQCGSVVWRTPQESRGYMPKLSCPKARCALAGVGEVMRKYIELAMCWFSQTEKHFLRVFLQLWECANNIFGSEHRTAWNRKHKKRLKLLSARVATTTVWVRMLLF